MNASSKTIAPQPSVVAQIMQLPDLPIEEIKALWLRLFGSEATTYNRQFLERRIAYKLQEVECRKTNAALLDRNKRRIKALVDTGQLKKRDRDVRPVSGTVLTREYQGKVHYVRVTQDSQYEFEGRLYQSLSMIAHEITGTRWSGPLFFGLKAPGKSKKKQGGRQ